MLFFFPKGLRNLHNHIREILENARKEVIVCTSARDFSDKLRLFTSMIQTLNKHKIKVKVALFGHDAEIRKLSNKTKIKIKKSKLGDNAGLIGAATLAIRRLRK